MNLKSTIALHGTGETWLNHPPGLITDTPKVRDIARRRLVRTNPDVDAAKVTYKEKPQTDENAFIGKKLRVQDTKYGHLISEHDNESSAKQAMLARPYSRILRHREPNQTAEFRNKTRKKVVNTNPDIV